ncbi:MAG: prephenate dehydrogenase/arogenate dehydrogenase family protein [Verrucomicrobiota bacterium]
MNFGTVAILGPGLIGGSLALALADRGLAERLMIYARSPHALDAIRVAGVDAELTQNPSEAVREADVVVLCVPIEAMAALGGRIPRRAQANHAGHRRRQREGQRGPRARAAAGGSCALDRQPSHGRQRAGRLRRGAGPISSRAPR